MLKRCFGCMETYDDKYYVCPYCGFVEGAKAEEAIHMDPGTILHNRYIIGKVLGFGGFGVTYLAWDGKLEQKVAIKEYLPGEFSTRMPGQAALTVFGGEKSQQFLDGMRKFIEEARHLAKFQNEDGIVRVFDSFEENSTAYITMEYLEGETLTEYLQREKTIPENTAIEMLRPVMKSLKVVHEAGLLHRDIAPDNIFLCKNGQIKLIDFGASRYATTSHSRSLTVIIKPGYSPEEQYRSKGDQGPHTDVYAMAATLYKMITGKTPPDAMERRAKYENQNKDILIVPHRLAKNISDVTEVALLNAMNVRIEDRTPTIDTFLAELDSDTPAKRIHGKIKRIDFYRIPSWIKITVPTALSLILIFFILLLTGVIGVSRFTEEITVPGGITTVPEVEGLYTNEAIELIEQEKLLALTGGTVESEYIAAGKIVLQSPIGGTYMAINETVVLTVSSGKSVQGAVNGISVVPYVIWDTVDDAIEKLHAAGLAEPTIIEQYDKNVAAGHVISQSIDPGEEVPEGSVIQIIVSLGSERFEIPDVESRTLEEAQKILEELGLRIEISYEYNEEIEGDHVISQNIAPGELVQRGDIIQLLVSSGNPTITVENVVGKDREEAENILTAQGFRVTVLENYDANVPAGVVISQTPNAGSMQIKDGMITVYVSKGAQPVKVSFDPNGGTVSSNSVTVIPGNAYGTLPTPVRKGYNFEGWYTQTVGGKQIAAATVVANNESHTLYAQWSAKIYSLTFDANGGTSSETTRSIAYGERYGQLPVPTKEGYTFAGWYTALKDGKKVTEATVMSDSNVVVYAIWTPNTYTVTFNGNGGVPSSEKMTVTYSQKYGQLPTAARDYYDFLGWYTSLSGGQKVDMNTVFLSSKQVTLYAHWNLKPVSDWVPADDIPANAQIVEEKWSYDRRETMESKNSSEQGWTPIGSRWEEVGSGSRNYATFPSGFDKSHSIYTSMSTSPYESQETENTKRVVDNQKQGYVYWHWMYDTSRANGLSTRAIYNKKGTGPVTGFYYDIFGAFTSTKGDYASDNQYCNQLGITNYIIPERKSFEECQGALRWFRFDYFKSTYTDYDKVYQYERYVHEESSTEVKEGGEISNVQKFVRYREK